MDVHMYIRLAIRTVPFAAFYLQCVFGNTQTKIKTKEQIKQSACTFIRSSVRTSELTPALNNFVRAKQRR